MEVTKLIKEKIQQNKVILGYKRVTKAMKTGHPILIILANNLPEEKAKIVKYNARIAKIDVEEYSGDSVSLGLICGKPFPVSILAIGGNEE